jgi:hypothetical protein
MSKPKKKNKHCICNVNIIAQFAQPTSRGVAFGQIQIQRAKPPRSPQMFAKVKSCAACAHAHAHARYSIALISLLEEGMTMPVGGHRALRLRTTGRSAQTLKTPDPPATILLEIMHTVNTSLARRTTVCRAPLLHRRPSA